MAPLAQPGTLHLQQRGVVGTVRRVAIHAVLGNRSMLPKEWATFFRMALVTVFINRIGCQQFLSRGTVRVVATGTVQLAFPDRHMACALDLGFLKLMALKAGFHRIGFCQHIIVRGRVMNTVACRAVHIFRIMNAPAPRKAGPVLMTG